MHDARFQLNGLVCELYSDHEDWDRLDLPTITQNALTAILKFTPASGEIAVKFTHDAEIARLNAQFRGKPGPTDVLSFPNGDDSNSPASSIGDIAISYGVSAKDAKKNSIPLENHISHLVIHGFLHCLGYDHMCEEDASTMEKIEADALAALEIANPYD